MKSPTGKIWFEMVTLYKTPWVLPYHVHSWSIAKAIPYLSLICQDDRSKCLMDRYADLSFAHWEEILGMNNRDTFDFWNNYWTPMVVKELGVDEAPFKALVTNEDHSLSEAAARKNWKYAASIGAASAPTAFVNGIKLDNYP